MTKKATNLRVHQLAKELGVDSKDIVAKCTAEEIPNIKDHMSVVSAGLAATVREWFSEQHGGATAVETAAVVDVVKARAKARGRTRKSAAGGATATVEDASESVDGAAASTNRPSRARKAVSEEVTETQAPQVAAEVTESVETIVKAAPAAAPAAGVEAVAKVGKTPAVEVGDAVSEGGRAKARVGPAAPPAATAPPAERAPVQAKAPAVPERKSRAPVMNIPQRPQVVTPVGPKLQAPKPIEMKGPKIIRVEQPDIIEPPRPKGAPRSAPSVGRGGPRAGRGVGAAEPLDPRGRGGGGGPDRGGESRRNKRRTGSVAEESGRTARGAHSALAGQQDRSFNWRQQDLLERENKLNRSTGFFKHAKRDNIKRATNPGHRAMVPAESGGKVRVQAPISIKDLSAATGVKAADIVRKLFLAGKMVTINSILDGSAAMEAVLDYNIELDVVEALSAEAEIAAEFQKREVTDERRRSPVVTILGHVDHGKTSLLDKIRNANVAAGEAGGITQATSAFQVPVQAGEAERMVTFIDTPGHEAFTEMRARGAKVTDVVVLVIAADDGVMPQTVESINHAKAAGVPIVVALNKIDKPEATDPNIQRILGQLASHELNPVEWGGTVEVVRTSATKGTGIQDLLEVLDYQAQLLDLKAGYGGYAQGTVLEAAPKEGRGAVANVLVQHGTLNRGDCIVVGRAFGRIRDIVNDRGQRIDTAMPGMPVAFSGINDLPDAGDKFYVVESLQEAEVAANERLQQERQRDLAKEKITLSNVFQHLEATGKKELSLIVKGDVQGSVETLRTVLSRIVSDEVTVSIKHAAVGGVNESDVGLAEASNAIIVGFNVTASAAARKLAEARGVDIRFYDVIYDLTDDVKAAAEGMLEPEVKLEVLGHAEVREVFKISRVGMIAGCYVTDGVIERNSQIRVTRGGIVIEKDRRLEQLKRFKEDMKEVRAGQECGMNIEGYNDIKSGDVLECYKTREVKRKL